MRIEAFIALAAQVYPMQARDQAVRGIDPKHTLELAEACREMAEHGGDVEPAPSFDGLVDIDLVATCEGLRRRLLADETIPIERLYVLGQVIDIVFVALQSKDREIKARIQKAQKGE